MLGRRLSLASPSGPACASSYPIVRGLESSGWRGSFQEDAGFQRARAARRWGFDSRSGKAADTPAPAAGFVAPPAIATPAELAFPGPRANQLDWFADCQSREGADPDEPLRHYRYRWVGKPSGSLRLIERRPH